MTKDLVWVIYQDDIVIKLWFDSTSHIGKPLKEIVTLEISFFGITSAKSPNILHHSQATLVQLGILQLPP